MLEVTTEKKNGHEKLIGWTGCDSDCDVDDGDSRVDAFINEDEYFGKGRK